MALPPVVAAPLWPRPRRVRLFASAPDAQRARRPTDVLLLVATSLSILVLGWRADAPSDVEDALIDLARSLPRALDLLWQVLTGVASLWVVVLLIATVARRRPAVLRDALLSTALAGVLVLLVEQVFLGTADAVSWHGLVAVGPPTGAISLRLALVAAVTVATSPHLTVPFRSLSRWLLAISAVGLVVLGATIALNVWLYAIV
ncbi:hypothetical protein, partial [Actinotalea sp.]|uniref:hypothetical protein n=1 Tax=Actinotalea sp. TaxID=1872145 RepID=UPI002C3AC02A